MDNLDKLLQQAEEKIKSLQDHDSREQKFAAEANIRFSKNYHAFQKYFPDVAETIANFKAREDFCLHVTLSGEGNFYPKDSDTPLYNDNPTKQAQEQVTRYTERAYFGRTNYFATQSSLMEDDRLHVKYMMKLANVLEKVPSHELNILQKLPKNFPTCLMFGIGLGYHLPVLLEQHTFDYLFICEPDLELFYASLFCIDWAEIIQKIDHQGNSLFLNIGITYDEFFESVRNISSDVGTFSIINSFCYQHYPSDEVNESIKQFFDNYYQLHLGFGFYNDAITGLSHAIHNIEQKAEFIFPHQGMHQKLRDYPVFVVANGPSLDNAIEMIKSFEDQVIIIAAGTALQSLVKAGIKPDFHVLVERTKGTYDAQIDFLEVSDDYTDLNLLAVDVMYPDVLPMYKWAGIGRKGPEAASAFLAVQTIMKYGRPVLELPFCAPLVANTALAYAVAFGFGDVYLLGVDNGYHMTGETHSKLSIYHDDKMKSLGYAAVSGADHKLPGNLGQDVMATNLMCMAKINMEKVIGLVPHINFFNVGHGAKLEGATAIKDDGVILSTQSYDKEALVEEIKDKFFQTIEVELSDEKLGFKEFSELCDYIIEIGERSYSNREEAHNILKAIQRVVYAYKDNQYSHLYHLIKGTLLYFHCPMVTLLYYYEEEKESLEWFTKTLDVWQSFIKAIKDDYPKNWKTKCNWSEFY